MDCRARFHVRWFVHHHQSQASGVYWSLELKRNENSLLVDLASPTAVDLRLLEQIKEGHEVEEWFGDAVLDQWQYQSGLETNTTRRVLMPLVGNIFPWVKSLLVHQFPIHCLLILRFGLESQANSYSISLWRLWWSRIYCFHRRPHKCCSCSFMFWDFSFLLELPLAVIIFRFIINLCSWIGLEWSALLEVLRTWDRLWSIVSVCDRVQNQQGARS